MNYKNLLSTIHNASIYSTSDIVVPSNKQLYEIDLNTREIKGPATLSVQSEHYAETVYFVVDRYYDRMDLAQANCVVQYVTSTGNYVYAVPFCDITTFAAGYSEENPGAKIIIPWSISASATKEAGTIKYFLRFYLIDETTVLDTDTDGFPLNAQFAYSLSTLPAQATILKTLANEEFTQEDKTLSEVAQALNPETGKNSYYLTIIDQLNKMVDNGTVYWQEADDLS